MTQLGTHYAEETLVSETSNAHAKAVELGKHVLRMTTAAGSGHPSTALSLCHIIVDLMYRRMRYDLSDPWNRANDRLVLSIGHAVPIVYAAYADLEGTVGSGPDDARALTVADLAELRELSSVLDGHPNPAEGFPFFDAATGSLGQGLSIGAGLALAARQDGIDKNIFVIAGDGESREGQVWEAADFMIDHKLTNVCVVFSCNAQGQAAPVSSQQSAEAIGAKMGAFGWDVIHVDGHDPEDLSKAFDRVGGGKKPVAVVARTIKGWGVGSIQDKNLHGKPIPPDDLDSTLAELDATGTRLQASADAMFRSPTPLSVDRPTKPGPIALPPFEQALHRVGLEKAFTARKLATRGAYGAALVSLGDVEPRIVSLDGDVANSTFAEFFAQEHPERFFECKIAEQNMISVGVGLSAGGKIPFLSTFGKFLARAIDQIDLATISRANLKIVGSHSGVSLGADGPSQMSLSDIVYFRSMTRVQDGRGRPVCHVFHPSDAICAYRCVELMANLDGLCYLRTHRPTATFLYPPDEQFTLRGCKQLRQGEHLTLVSAGYMLYTVLEAADQLAERGVQCNVFDAYTLPLESAPIFNAAGRAGGVILTVEDNYIGGLHAELAESAAMSGEARVHGMTVERIPKSAKTAAEVFSHVGVGLEQIVAKAAQLAAF